MKARVAIFLHHPKCSVQSANGIIKALDPNYTFKIFTRHELEDSFFDNIDLVVFPGGIGDSDSYEYLLKENVESVRKFVKRGGKYLGICMGAYWAGHHYFDILDEVKAEQYIKRPDADVRRSFGTVSNITWKGQEESMYFYDGCSLLGDESKFDTVARYPNGDPMAIMQNRVGIIGCHPEALPSWYDKKHLKPHWHNYQHHKLLLDFTNELLAR
jgi:hypothetical protein